MEAEVVEKPEARMRLEWQAYCKALAPEVGADPEKENRRKKKAGNRGMHFTLVTY